MTSEFEVAQSFNKSIYLLVEWVIMFDFFNFHSKLTILWELSCFSTRNISLHNFHFQSININKCRINSIFCSVFDWPIKSLVCVKRFFLYNGRIIWIGMRMLSFVWKSFCHIAFFRFDCFYFIFNFKQKS